MRRPTFLNGVLAAAGLGFLATVLATVLLPLMGFGPVARLLIPVLALAYLLYLSSRTSQGTGRVTALALWTGLALITWWLAPPLPLYLVIHLGAIWLLRSLCFYSGALPAVMDLGLSALSGATAVWALSRTGSVFLAVWACFLVQALFVAVPSSVRRPAGRDPHDADAQFARARRRAEAALEQLITQ